MRLAPLCIAIVLAAPAAASPLTASDIRTEIVGRRIYLAAPMGGEFPLNYRRDGVVDGSGEALGLGRFMKPSDQGKWWITGDRLCQQFRTWYNGSVLCFTLERSGPGRVRWTRDNGDSGMARIGGAAQ